MDLSWSDKIANNAHRTLREAKKNKVTILPLSKDVKLLSDFLKDRMIIHCEQLKEDASNIVAYNHLKKELLTGFILFNRRRSGETSRMTLEDYYDGGKGKFKLTEDLGFSDLEKALASSLRRIEITGKKGRIVPMLLPKVMASSLDLLVSCRSEVGVPESNQYVFNNNSDFGNI